MHKLLLSILTLTLISCTKDEVDPALNSISDKTTESDTTKIGGYEVWTGPIIEFTKEDNADPNKKINQDSITPSVSLTRGDYGEIYNVNLETIYEKGVSPKGTKWAIGDLSELESLNFVSFRAAVEKPKKAVGKNLVLHITAENVYLSVEFTSWSEGKKGGFAYKRSTVSSEEGSD